jgi:hypothetical protein
MFRVFCYVNGSRLVSNVCPSVEVADSFLSAVLSMPGAEGGAVEEFRAGLGWFAHIPAAEFQLSECC